MLSMVRSVGRPAAAVAFGIGALALVAYVALALRRVDPALLGGAAGFAFLCDLVTPQLPVLGAALIPMSIAVLAPCLLQLSLVLVAATAGLAATSGRALLPAGVAFASGFLGFYLLAALGVGLLGVALAEWAFALRALGGLLILLLGFAVLRILPQQFVNSCRGPNWLIYTGKASLRKPFGAGIAFALYCIGCCGPYLAGLALLGASTGSVLGGAGLVFGFALLMGTLLLLPLAALQQSRALSALLRQKATPIALSSGITLVTLGAVLSLEPVVVWMFMLIS